MATVTTDNANYTAIANAIRGKNGETTQYLPSAMAAAISAIASGGGTDYDMSASYVAKPKNEPFAPVLDPLTTTIGASTFYQSGFLALTSLPDGITDIESSAFYNCGALALTSLPTSLVNIGNYAFYYCAKLAFTYLPSTLKTISTDAFYSCRGLKSITFEGTPTSISNRAFYYCGNIVTINVPWAEGAVANAPWGATNATINYNYVGV